MDIKELKDGVIAKADEMLKKEDLTVSELEYLATIVKTLENTLETTMLEMCKTFKPTGEKKDEQV